MRRPIQDTDLLRFVDAVIFGEKMAQLTPLELAEARKSQQYTMLQRLGCAMYRAGEQGLRPRPALQVVDRAAPQETAQAAGAEDGAPTTASA